MTYSPPKLTAVEDLLPKDGEGKPLPVRRKPGRPRRVVVPTVSELAVAKLVNADRERFVAEDGLVQSLDCKAPTQEILRTVLVELAAEAAAIKFEIRSAQAASRSEGQAQRHSRVIDSYSKMALTTLEMQKLGLHELDLRGQSVQRIFQAFLESVSAVADSTLQDADGFKGRIREALVGWEDRVSVGTE